MLVSWLKFDNVLVVKRETDPFKHMRLNKDSGTYVHMRNPPPLNTRAVVYIVTRGLHFWNESSSYTYVCSQGSGVSAHSRLNFDNS